MQICVSVDVQTGDIYAQCVCSALHLTRVTGGRQRTVSIPCYIVFIFCIFYTACLLISLVSVQFLTRISVSIMFHCHYIFVVYTALLFSFLSTFSAV